MKERILLVLSMILAFSSIVFAQKATKTVTNADLEKFRQKRLKAEKEYRATYQKRGMPSPEEIERIEAERQRSLTEFAREAQQQRAENENDIRQRAATLKNEIISVEAQINYLSNEANNQQRSSYLGGTVWSPSPYGIVVPYGNRGGFGRGGYRNRSGIELNFPRQNRYGMRYPRYRGGYVIPLGNPGDAEADDLKSRLSNLEQVRAGLYAQWSDLEDEARRAGVKID